MVHTGISLNDRFTQIQTQQSVTRRRRSRSRSRKNGEDFMDSNASSANARLLQELKRKHTMQAAMKLKRRSLRTAATSGGGVGGAAAGRRAVGTRPLRLAPNGKPIRTNNSTRVATMRADLVANSARRSGGSIRRSSSSSGLRQRLNLNRPIVGGAAERVARRRVQRNASLQRRRNTAAAQFPKQQPIRGRSRSRSRPRQTLVSNNNATPRSRSRSRSRGPNTSRGLNTSRGRARSVSGKAAFAQPRISVKQRLGQRGGAVAISGGEGKRRRNRRSGSKLRGVAQGRIEKRRGSTGNATVAQKGAAVNAAGRGRRPRGRSAVRAAAEAGASTRRSRSRRRSNAATAAAATPAKQPGSAGRRRRGRSAQRAGGKSGNKNGNNSNNNATGAKAKSQQGRRGRSRGGRGGRIAQGKIPRPEVKREDLDKELDQYMSTTKSEMDYLLK